MNTNYQIITVNVYHCSGCTRDHQQMTFKKLRDPLHTSDGQIYTYYAICPNTRDVIYLKEE